MRASRIFLLVILVAGLISSLGVARDRWQAEAADSRVAVVMVPDDLSGLVAETPDATAQRLLARLQAAGLQGLIWQPDLVSDLMSQGDLRYESDAAFRQDLLLGRLTLPGLGNSTSLTALPARGTVLFFFSPSLRDRVAVALDRQYRSKGTLRPLISGPSVWVDVTALPNSLVGRVAVAPPPSSLPYPAIRPAAPTDLTPAALSYLDGPARQGSVVIFPGSTVPGAPGSIGDWAVALGPRAVVGNIDGFPQEGLSTLAARLGGRAVRVYSLSGSQVGDAGGSLPDAWSAVANRRIRLVVLHPPLTGDPGSDLGTTQDYLHRLWVGLRADGFQPGQPEPVQLPARGPLAPLLAGLAAIAAAFFLLDELGLELWVTRLFGPILLVAAYVLLRHPDTTGRTLALLAGTSLPLLGFARFLRRPPTGFGGAVRAFLRVSLYSWSGALLVTGLLSSRPYLQGFQLFWGTKTLFLVPPLLFFALFLYRQGYGLSRLAALPLRLSHLFWLVAGVVVGGVYLTRTGNDSIIPVSTWELAFRSDLRRYLPARPRTKEFLLGHPAFLLGAFLLGSRRPWLALPFLLLGSIGQVDMVDTFAHLISPLRSAVLRTGTGWIFGLVLGFFLLALVLALFPRLRRSGKETP